MAVVLLASLLGLAMLTGCVGRADRAVSQTSVLAIASSVVASPTSAPDDGAMIASSRVTSNATPPCRTSDLELGAGRPVSEPTGQHTISLTLTNRSPQACALSGYPQVTLLDAGERALPFEYRHQGDQVVTSAAPKDFELAAGAVAYLTINKYRCDLGDQAVVKNVRLLLPGEQTSLSFALPSSTSVFGFCGADDPGSVVSISPLEATFRATLRH